jgi:hypothetical protein
VCLPQAQAPPLHPTARPSPPAHCLTCSGGCGRAASHRAGTSMRCSPGPPAWRTARSTRRRRSAQRRTPRPGGGLAVRGAHGAQLCVTQPRAAGEAPPRRRGCTACGSNTGTNKNATRGHLLAFLGRDTENTGAMVSLKTVLVWIVALQDRSSAARLAEPGGEAGAWAGAAAARSAWRPRRGALQSQKPQLPTPVPAIPPPPPRSPWE